MVPVLPEGSATGSGRDREQSGVDRTDMNIPVSPLLTGSTEA